MVRDMLNRRGALTRFSAYLKSSLLNGLDRLHKVSAGKAVKALTLAVAEKILERKTPGAFGSAIPQGRRRRPKWVRANYAASNCGRGMPDLDY